MILKLLRKLAEDIRVNTASLPPYPEDLPPEAPPPGTYDLQSLRPSKDKEKPTDDLDRRSIELWSRVDAGAREAVVRLIREEVPPRFLEQWRGQAERDVSIGSDDPWFHMGIGMQLRNLCRRALKDDELPAVEWTHIDPPVWERNWDDYYVGALYEAVS